jgi:uncharacterized protein
MKCPVDKQDMIVIEYHDIEIDYCETCGGVWLDAGEFDLLVDVIKDNNHDISDPWDIIQTNEKGKKCPVCGHRMDKMFFKGDNKVIVDSCPLGDGIWFDGGELHQILRKFQKESTVGKENVLSFLAEALKAGTVEDRTDN